MACGCAAFLAYILMLSGSAFPATLAFQIRELERETDGDLKLDAIVTVVDAENFTGYEDTSPTAKMQASYTDVILIVRVPLIAFPTHPPISVRSAE
jgi:G3E family GTPase